MVWSPNARTYKIDSSTLKNNDGWQQYLDIPQEVHFLRSETKMAQMGDKFRKIRVPLSENFRILLRRQGFINFNLTLHLKLKQK